MSYDDANGIYLETPLYHFQKRVLLADLDRAETLEDVKAVLRGLIEELTDRRSDKEHAEALANGWEATRRRLQSV
jgi:hypothetical protein